MESYSTAFIHVHVMEQRPRTFSHVVEDLKGGERHASRQRATLTFSRSNVARDTYSTFGSFPAVELKARGLARSQSVTSACRSSAFVSRSCRATQAASGKSPLFSAFKFGGGAGLSYQSRQPRAPVGRSRAL